MTENGFRVPSLRTDYYLKGLV